MSIISLTPELSQRLKQHFENVLIDIIQRNRVCRYATESLPLLAFRNSLDELSGGATGSEVIAETFRNTVPFTDYDTYEPFIRKLLEQPCKQAEVENLLSTGYPTYITLSSMTTGKSMKYFPKYDFPRPSPREGSVSLRSMYNCVVVHLGVQQTLVVKNETGEDVATYPLCTVSTGMARTTFNVKVGQEQAVMDIKVPPLSSPLAVSFINNYRSFLLMHALFALAKRHLETLYTSFGTILIDFIKFMEEEWNTLLASIDTGVLPTFDGTEHVLPYLQQYFSANPARAAELRSIESMRGSPGWLKKIWPNFKEYTGIMSGVYSGVFSKIQSLFDDESIILRSSGYILSECWPGITYRGVNSYKLAGEDYYEFLPASQIDIDEDETAACLIPAWQVETGKTYEPVVTTRDGLWRYRLGDLVRIEGFESQEGFPIMNFLERRHLEIRLGDATIPPMVLVNAILSTTEDTIGRVVEFTSYYDARGQLPTVGYVVELDGDIGPNSSLARHQVLEVLTSQHDSVRRNVNMNKMGLPTIRVVARGRFAEYRRWRVDTAGISLTQVKIPAVLKDETQLEWLLEGIVHEVQ